MNSAVSEDTSFIPEKKEGETQIQAITKTSEISKEQNEGFLPKAWLIIKSCNVEPILMLNMMSAAMVQVKK